MRQSLILSPDSAPVFQCLNVKVMFCYTYLTQKQKKEGKKMIKLTQFMEAANDFVADHYLQYFRSDLKGDDRIEARTVVKRNVDVAVAYIGVAMLVRAAVALVFFSLMQLLVWGTLGVFCYSMAMERIDQYKPAALGVK